MRGNSILERRVKIALFFLVFVLAFSFTLNKMNNITGAAVIQERNNLAKCLTENGATLFIENNCPVCDEQKRIFSSSSKYLNFIDCSENKEYCKSAGIYSYPTWIIHDQLFVDIHSLEDLKLIAGCI